MTFKELKIGDTFSIEESEGEVRYIKTEWVIVEFIKNDDDKTLKFRNAVCIDEYSSQRGQFKFVLDKKLVYHVNYS